MSARRAAPTFLALVTAFLVGCAPVAPTPSPAATAAATDVLSTGAPGTMAPSTEASPGPTYGPDNVAFITNVAGVVTVDQLPIYDAASVTAPSIGAFARGDVVLLLLFEPIVVDGTRWQYAEKLETPEAGVLPALPASLPDGEFAPTGWITATDATGETVRTFEPRCPETRDFSNVAAMLPGERLACFGANPITLNGRYTCGDCDDAVIGDQEPDWLANHPRGLLRDPSGDTPSLGQFFGLYFPPPVEAPTQDMPMRVTGHFNDPRALTCTLIFDGIAAPAEIPTHLCQLRFVVDSFEPLRNL